MEVTDSNSSHSDEVKPPHFSRNAHNNGVRDLGSRFDSDDLRCLRTPL